MVSTAAFHARVRGSVPGLGGLKETKMFLPHPRVKLSIVGSLRDREVACSASDRQGSNFESCVWRTVSSHPSHHPQEVLLAQFCLYVDKSGLKPDSFHCDNWRDENVTVLKMVAMPIALAYVVALVRFGNDQIMCLKTDATSFKADNHVTNSSYIEMIVCMCDTVNDRKISHYKMM